MGFAPITRLSTALRVSSAAADGLGLADPSVDESDLDLPPGWIVGATAAPPSIQRTYEQFLRAVVEVLDDALQQSAKGGTFDGHKLGGWPGAASPALRRAAELAGELRARSAAIGGDAGGGAGVVPSKSSSIHPFAGDVVEFGSDLDFRAPSSASAILGLEKGEEQGWRNLNLSGPDSKGGARGIVEEEDPSLPYGKQDLFEEWPEVEAWGGAEESGDRPVVDLRWCREMCDRVAESVVKTQFSGDELALAVARILESERSGDEAAGDLFDLIGDAWFDFIQQLLQHRSELVELIRKGLTGLKEETAPAQSRMPSYGTQVTVQTGSERQGDKLRRKEAQRQARKGFGATGDGDFDFGFAALVDSSERGKDGIEGLMGKGDHAHGLGGAALPAGSVRKAYDRYEEVRIPATPTAPVARNERMVAISELDDYAQLAFEGYKRLNRIQSRIFPTAYGTNENILVCAPTGAGKTNIAMIAVLREIGQHLAHGVLQRKEFKIVYVAPMKALAAEMTSAFGRRLAPLGVAVKELTGDMQLTKREMEETQMIVTTPEKWDVITRKSSDMDLSTLVKLLIIDEVHLLNDDRGPVIETIVARTLRQVERTQSMIRIVGLSATLPNYLEVAAFLHVNKDTGLFYFDASYRPVPLSQQYIGVSEPRYAAQDALMSEICYDKIWDAVRSERQALVFVHSRKDTVKTARILVEIAQQREQLEQFTNVHHDLYGFMKKDFARSRNREIESLFQSSFGVHHAGMLRSDRNLVERAFSEGLIKVLVCTATLAWGVNLPAHTVVIKGTQLYDSKAGGFRELGMLDVMQIFGRAGRPQFDTSGEGIIITTHAKLAHYLRLMTHQLPIESQFVSALKDNLNAEVVLGSVTNMREASMWLGYTYLYVRMTSNPLVYGMTWDEVLMDPDLVAKRKALVTDAARALDKAQMMRFDERSGNLYPTDLGRVASHFYIQYKSVECYNEMLKQHMNDDELIHLVAHSSEFENIIVREEEQLELARLMHDSCPLMVRGGPDDKFGKINILIQVYISRDYLEAFSLIADSAYISASLGRIMRALFEICIRRGWCSMAALLLEYCKAVDRRLWPHQHPLRQFEALSQETLHKLEDRGAGMEQLYDMDEGEIGSLVRHPHAGKMIKQYVNQFPLIQLSVKISPITRTVLRVALTIWPEFSWKDQVHGASERWHIWVEDSQNEHIYHSEIFVLTKKIMAEGSYTITFTIPIFEPLPSQYYVRAASDSWLQASTIHAVSFKHLILPELYLPHTELLDLRPLPITALGNKVYENRYKFSHFNPIQTQAFHTLYHTDNNVLLGAPTGSGKTISAELAMLHLFNTQPDLKVIYIAPLKALVKERMDDWKKTLVPAMGKKLVELTGDFTPDVAALLAADIVITTPEKWDGVSRDWKNRSHVTKVGLVVIDEIHLLGADRGPILEVIVSRMRYISSQTDRPVRFVGLSTALANAGDLADWLGIQEVGLFNFRPSVRPVPLEVHVQGYPGKFYCPRMNSMNKPTYAAITTHSKVKPVLVFVSSRRQTRLTALDLIQYAIADECPRQFSRMTEDEIGMVLSQVVDPNLKHTLQFGIGIHHAGLNERDRTLVEELFANVKIQVLVCTTTLAWGVNLPAHLVVIKGTEYFDGKLKRYVDFPITDILQMMGRAGRPQFDTHGKAVILVHEPKKSFYKKFLYEPFPVESSLAKHLHNHFNAEIVSGTIGKKQDAVDYLTWTYLFQRLSHNPSYYNLEDTSWETINSYLSTLVVTTFQALEDAGCISVDEDGAVEPLMLGMVASQYYLNYTTVSLFSSNISVGTSLETLLHVLCGAAEYDELPVRHNEDKLNEALAKEVRYGVNNRLLDDPHVKTNLLLQAHFSRLELPVSDYVTDTKSVLDQSIRIMQAMVDVAANNGWLQTALNTMHLLQMVMQGLWDDDSPLSMLPHMKSPVIDALSQSHASTLQELQSMSADKLQMILRRHLSPSDTSNVVHVLSRYPKIDVRWKVVREGGSEGSEGSRFVRIWLSRKTPSRSASARAYVPRFPKIKEEGWWLVLGNPHTSELLTLKRVTFVDQLTTRLEVRSNSEAEYISLFIVSDCYLGFDMTFPL